MICEAAYDLKYANTRVCIGGFICNLDNEGQACMHVFRNLLYKQVS